MENIDKLIGEGWWLKPADPEHTNAKLANRYYITPPDDRERWAGVWTPTRYHALIVFVPDWANDPYPRPLLPPNSPIQYIPIH